MKQTTEKKDTILNEIEEFLISVNSLLFDLKKIKSGKFTDKQVYSIIYAKEKGVYFKKELENYKINTEKSNCDGALKSIILTNIETVRHNLDFILQDIKILNSIAKTVPIEYKRDSLALDGYISTNSVLNSKNRISITKIHKYTELSSQTTEVVKKLIKNYIIVIMFSVLMLFAYPFIVDFLLNALDLTDEAIIIDFVKFSRLIICVCCSITILINVSRFAIHLMYIYFPVIRNIEVLNMYLSKDVQKLLNEDSIVEINKTRVVNLIEYAQRILEKLNDCNAITGKTYLQLQSDMLKYNYRDLSYHDINTLVSVEIMGELKNKEYS